MNVITRARAASALLATTFAVALAACGGDDEASTASEPAETTATQAAAGSDCTGTATTKAQEFAAEVALKLPAEPLDLTKVKGKTLFFVSVINNEFSLAVLEGYEDAVTRMGGKAVIFDAKGAAPEFTKGVQQAVTQKADGIVLFGIAPGLVSKPLKEAVDAGVPVIDVFNGQPDAELTDGLKAHVSADYDRSGEALGNWMLADSKCTAKAAMFQTPVIGLYKPMTERVPQVFDEVCQDECSFDVQDADLATFSTKLGPQVSSYVRRKPDTGYVQVSFDSMITFVGPALAQSGSDVKLVGHDGIPSVLDAIRKDDGPTKATMAFPPEAWIGWNIADTLARAIAEQDTGDSEIPTRLVDKTNVGENNQAVYPEYDGFEEKWEASWTSGG